MDARAGGASQALFRLGQLDQEIGLVLKRQSLIHLFGFGIYAVQDPPDSLIATAINLLERGAPTLASVQVEAQLERTFSWHQAMAPSSTGSLSWQAVIDRRPGGEAAFPDLVLSALLPDASVPWILTREGLSRLDPESPAERVFLETFWSAHAPAWLLPLIQFQAPVELLLDVAGSAQAQHFPDQRVDFFLPLYGPACRGLILEVDGDQHHKEPAQKALDDRRDRAMREVGYRVLRFPTQDLGAVERWQQLGAVLAADPVLKRVRAIRNRADLEEAHREVRAWVQAAGDVVRVERLLLEALARGLLDLDREAWVVTVTPGHGDVLRRVYEDLRHWFGALLKLEGRNRVLPQVIFGGGESPEIPDLALDWDWDGSVCFRRSEARSEVPSVPFLQGFGHGDIPRPIPIRSAEPISWVGLFQEETPKEGEAPEPDPERVAHLEILLRMIFRKMRFLNGQIPILDRVLRRQSVVGLLPTGGGKSLTFQLPALLQPGVTLVVDPLRSLMQDQVKGVRQTGIDRVASLSSLQDAVARTRVQDALAAGLVQLTFVSPERFQIREFRIQCLDLMRSHNHYVAHVVLDEVHCVSEWGHDFRTPYLRIGRNARRFCPAFRDTPLPLIGLTATASYDVLADVQRELELGEGEVLPYEAVDREELTYRVHPMAFQDRDYYRDFDRSRALGLLKQQVVATLVAEQENGKLEGEGLPAGIVFTPWKQSSFGATTIREGLANAGLLSRTGVFFGGDGSDHTREMASTQDQFVRGDLDLLCATKAFGMGIDKPDIRYTIHLNHPNSIESFYQEAGRAGRDRNPAICTILWADSIAERKVHDFFYSQSFPGIQEELEMIEKLLTGFTDQVVQPRPVQGLYEALRDVEPGQSRWVTFPYGTDPTSKNTSRPRPIFNDKRLMKAIYRLSLVGLVDDWEVDYRGRQVIVNAIRPTSGACVDHVRAYLVRYLSRKKAENYLARFLPAAQEPRLRDMTTCLVTFAYEEIAEKRRQAERIMVQALKGGKDQGADEFRKILTIYFTSKYYEDLFQATDGGRESRFTVVLDFLDRCDGKIDNFKHLRGACWRLLAARPDNGAVLALSALCRLLLERPDPGLFGEALQAIRQGLVALRQDEAWSAETTWSIAQEMFHKLEELDARVAANIDGLCAALRVQLLAEEVRMINQHFAFSE